MTQVWKRQAGSASPDYEGHGATLRERAKFADEALDAYSHGTLEQADLREWTLDLLADLMHLCDREDWDFRTLMNEARELRYLRDININEQE